MLTTTATSSSGNIASQSQSQSHPQILLQGKTFDNFINAIKSPKSREGYTTSLKRYLNHLKLTEVNDLLINQQYPRLIESQIIDYIMTLRNDGLAYASIQFMVAPIMTFYSLNDIVLNRKKISRYFGEYKRVVKDHAYTVEEINKALQTADQRMKLVILLLTSTGQRIGSLSVLTLGSLTRIEDYGIYKVTIYEGTNNEYYTFTTREFANAYEEYMAYRQRCGEKISFNNETKKWEPEQTPLIRKQFDVTDLLQARHPQFMDTNSIRKILGSHLVKCGIRNVEHPTAPKSTKRCRKAVALANGFRKFTISSFIRAGLRHEIRELLVDHSTQLDQNYFRPGEEEVLEQYILAEPYLTMDPSVRLSQENQTLTMDRNKLESRLERLEQVCKDFM